MRSRRDTIGITTRRRIGRAGYLLTEIVIALGVLGVLLSCMAQFHHSTAKYEKFLRVRRQCVAAGQAQLDSLAATGRAIDAEQVERLWPGVACTVGRREGEGQWGGLTLVTVEASASVNHRDVSLSQSRYLAPREEERP